MKHIRKRLTYANVMSSLAVFLVLGGATAFAATKIGANEIKANSIKTGKIVKEAVTAGKIKAKAVTESRIADAAVTTNKLADNAVTTTKLADKSVTGAKLDLPSIGTVPNAENAVNAQNAANASKVNGVGIIRFSFNQTSPAGPTQILDLNGLQLIANCPAGAVVLTATTTVNDSEISAENTNATANPATFSFGAFDDSFNIGDAFVANGADHTDIQGRIGYTSGTFNEVEVFFHEEDSVAGKNCVLNGYAMGS